MKWFKHFSDASDDEFVALLEEEFGLAGYARWFKLLEVIARQMDKTDRCYAEYSEQKWCYFLKAKRKQLTCFLVTCEKQLKINQEASENIIRISVPKLLKIKDNYTKDYQETTKRLPSKEVEVEVEEEVKTSSAYGIFLNLWNPLPPEMKKGKERAWDSFKNQVVTENDFANIQKALKHYLYQVTFFRANGHPERQYQHGSTWFNGNWKDYIDSTVTGIAQGSQAPKKKTNMDQAYEGKGPFVDKIKEMWAMIDAKHPDTSPQIISEAILKTIQGKDLSAALRVMKDSLGLPG